MSQAERPIRRNVAVNERRQCPEVFRMHARLPLWFVQYLLDH